ncbi:MAG: hypothetical protein H7296_09420 [Bacteroidia bacterium]|nr:hypothetical protein [Bacteroidia bacterium]
MLLIILEKAQDSSFTFWFITEAVGAAVVFALLYIFLIKNPKINRPPKRNEEED